MNLFYNQVQEAKELFNEYSAVKTLYSTSPTSDNETMLREALAALLRKVLDVYRSLGAKTESAAERDLFRQFAKETAGVFK